MVRHVGQYERSILLPCQAMLYLPIFIPNPVGNVNNTELVQPKTVEMVYNRFCMRAAQLESFP